jgi:hypothetical protein
MKTGKKVLLAFCLLLVIWQSRIFAQSSGNSCIRCHLRLEFRLSDPAKKITDDIHQKNGLSCADCHGGDPNSADPKIAMSPTRGFRGAPLAKDVPGFCGRCHSNPETIRKFNPSLATDQLEKYWTSKHGQLLRKGDTKVAECVSCHGVHDIRAINDPISSVYALNVPRTCSRCHGNAQYMESYHIPTNQYELFRTSVHGIALLKSGDLGAPACNDCHGNHAAIPPGFSSVGKVCYQCHPAEGELFEASPHKEGFDALGEEECVYCHGNHGIQHPTDNELGVGDSTLCIKCHQKGDNGYNAAANMRKAIDTLVATYNTSKVRLEASQAKGVEVSDAIFHLKDVQDAIVNVRKLVHAFNGDKFITAANQALVLANDISKEGSRASAEVTLRRLGLAVFTIITLVLLLIVYLKIRKLDRRNKAQKYLHKS